MARELSYRFAFWITTGVFFSFGFITALNDVLIPQIKTIEMTYSRVMLIQFCFFAAYFVMALPSGPIISRVGYKGGIIVGLLLSAFGALLVLPAAAYGSYEFFLGALFVLASGLTLLQCSTQPYVSLLGNASTAASRLNFAGAMNSTGHAVGPAVGGALIWSASTIGVGAVQPLYTAVVVFLVLLALIIGLFHLPSFHIRMHEAVDAKKYSYSEVWRHQQLRFGVVAIFVYVGAEVSIGSFIGSYALRPDIGGVSKETVAYFVSIYWTCAMAGRFLGVPVLARFSPRRVLGLCAIINIIFLSVTISQTGLVALWSVLVIGLFNSIMFPTIFTLAIAGLGALTQKAASLLIMAIFGGAVIPLIQGKVADVLLVFLGQETAALQYAFIVPILCYAYIAWYAFSLVRDHAEERIPSEKLSVQPV